jgi:Ca2+-binding RTX toxin-like protein
MNLRQLGARLSNLEQLESRRMLSISTYKGTQGADVARVGVGATSLDYFIILNGKQIAKGSFMANDPDKAIFFDLLAGNDLLTVDNGFGGKLRIYGGAGNDTLIGGSGGESLLGREGNDSLVGNGGPDKLIGGAGNDLLDGGTKHVGKDTLLGGAGDDNLIGGGGNDVIHGGDDDDVLFDGAGNDKLFGEAGNDTLDFDRQDLAGTSGGSDTFDGGTGTNTLLAPSTLPVSISLDGVANDGVAGDHANITPTFQIFDLHQFPGGSKLDASGATSGVKVLFFGLKAGSDNLNHLSDPTVTIIGSAFNDDISKGGYFDDNVIAQSIDGGAGDDSIDGDANADTLLGGPGNDTLRGGDGADSIDGGAGNDSIDGGVGNDTIYGGDGNDYVQAAGGRDTVNGGAGKDTLFGGSGKDTLNGAGGNDILYGGPSDTDHIIGGAGTDSAARDSKDSYTSVETLLTS